MPIVITPPPEFTMPKWCRAQTIPSTYKMKQLMFGGKGLHGSLPFDSSPALPAQHLTRGFESSAKIPCCFPFE